MNANNRPAIDWPTISALATTLAGALLAWRSSKSSLERAAETERVEAEAEHALTDAGLAAAQSVNLLLDKLNERITQQNEEINGLNQRQRLGIQERHSMQAKYDAEIAKLKADYEEERRCLQFGIDQVKEQAVKDRQAFEGVRAQMQAQITELRSGIGVLIAQLEQAGILPRYKPRTGPLNPDER